MTIKLVSLIFQRFFGMESWMNAETDSPERSKRSRLLKGATHAAMKRRVSPVCVQLKARVGGSESSGTTTAGGGELHSIRHLRESVPSRHIHRQGRKRSRPTMTGRRMSPLSQGQRLQRNHVQSQAVGSTTQLPHALTTETQAS